MATTLGSWEEPHLTDTIQLLMSELVTNVLVHTTSTPAVRITLLRNHVHVEVIEAADGAVMSMLRAADRGQLDVRTDQQRAA